MRTVHAKGGAHPLRRGRMHFRGSLGGTAGGENSEEKLWHRLILACKTE